MRSDFYICASFSYDYEPITMFAHITHAGFRSPTMPRKFTDDYPTPIDYYMLRCIAEGAAKQKQRQTNAEKKRAKELQKKEKKENKKSKKKGRQSSPTPEAGSEDTLLFATTEEENLAAADDLAEAQIHVEVEDDEGPEEDPDNPLVAARVSLREDADDALLPEPARQYADVPTRPEGTYAGPPGWFPPGAKELEKYTFEGHALILKAAQEEKARRALLKASAIENESEENRAKRLEQKLKDREAAKKIKEAKETEAKEKGKAETKPTSVEDIQARVRISTATELELANYECRIDFLKEKISRLQLYADDLQSQNSSLIAQVKLSIAAAKVAGFFGSEWYSTS